VVYPKSSWWLGDDLRKKKHFQPSRSTVATFRSPIAQSLAWCAVFMGVWKLGTKKKNYGVFRKSHENGLWNLGISPLFINVWESWLKQMS
jgi:hypothetical protein